METTNTPQPTPSDIWVVQTVDHESNTYTTAVGLLTDGHDEDGVVLEGVVVWDDLGRIVNTYPRYGVVRESQGGRYRSHFVNDDAAFANAYRQDWLDLKLENAGRAADEAREALAEANRTLALLTALDEAL